MLSTLQSANPPLPPAPGSPQPWQPGYPVYSGVVNLATGNLQLVHPVCGWGGKGGGISFVLTFNSQSARSSSLGPKWTHSYHWQVLSQSNQAIVVAGDGTETVFTLSGGQYVPPAGVYDQLVRNADNTWTLTHKGGLTRYFLADGRLDRIVDLNGNTVQCTYSGGNLVSVTDASGRVLQLGYSGSRLMSVTDAEGRVWTLSYDGSGRLVSVNDPLLNGVSYSTQFGYDSNNNVVRITNRLGKTWSYGYSTNSRFASMTDPDGRVWSLGYSSGGGMERYGRDAQPIDATLPIPMPPIASEGGVRDPSGVTVHYGMTSSGELGVLRDGLGNQTVFNYDAQHNRTAMMLPSGAVWRYSYDARGNQLSVRDPLNNTTSYQYGSYDRVTLVQDPLGNQTHYGYDARGNLTQVTDPLGNTTSYTVDSSGLVTAVTDAMGRQTQFSYDSTGNLTQVRDPLGNTTRYTYQCCRVVQRTDALGRVTTYSYDAWGRLVGIDYPQSADVSLQYDAEGRLTQAVDGTGTRTFEYDSWGRRVRQTAPAGTSTATYDAAGRLTSQTDVTGRQMTYQYDGAGRLVRVSDPTSWVQYTYNANSAVVRETYSNNTRVEYVYDGAGRVTSVQHRVHSTNALIIGYAVTYDAAGRVVRINESPSNAVTTYQYDGAGRLLREERTVNRPYLGEYQYDASGNRTFARSVENGVETHRRTYTYDGAGRLVRVSDPTSWVQYAYNANSAVIRETYSNNTRVEYVYDSAGRVTSLQHRVHSTNALIIGYAVTYDAAGRVVRINESPSNAVTTYQYDGAGRLLREERTVNRPYLGEYQYDASGNRTFARRVENGVETHRGTYTYDGAGRLIQVVDAATNTTETYVWNADGTLASFPGPGYTRLLEYDEEGRLVRIRRDYGGGNVQLAYEYGYGFDGGRRWRKDYLNGVWTRYPCGVACGAGELVEQQKPLEGGSWTVSALYLQGISLVRRNNEWHHFDPLGTAQVITNSSAQVVSNNVYDVFGVLRHQQGSAQTPWRMVGKRVDDESTLFQTAKVSCNSGGTIVDNILPGAMVSMSGIRPTGIAVHGKWCGPGHPGSGCRGPGLPRNCQPIDELDSCCMAHDTCYDQNGCGASGIVLNPTCWYCDCILWNCALKADCTKSPNPKSCERAKRLILIGIGATRPWWCLVTAAPSRY